MTGGARLGAGRKPANFDHNRAIKLKEQGMSSAEIAKRFGVSVYAIQWFFRKRKNEKTTHAQDQRTTQE
jgi:DNA invertase Pin-like site-specific DNA recombinase